MVKSSKVLNNLEVNRNISPQLDSAKKDFDTKKRIQRVEHNNIIRELKRNKESTINEFLRYNQECANTDLDYKKITNQINSKKRYGYIVVNYNDSILFDLSTMQVLDRKKVYKKDEKGNEILKEDLIVINQHADTSDSTKLLDIATKNVLFLREIAYLYFKYSSRADINEFKKLVYGLEKRYNKSYITEEDFNKLYNYLILRKLVDAKDIEKNIEIICNATKKVYEKRFNRANENE